MDIIGGYVSKLEVKTSKAGKEFTKFSIGENIKVKDKSSDLMPAKYDTDWYDVVQWYVNPELQDGHKVLVHGQRGEREWEGKVYKTFEAFHVQIIGAKRDAAMDKFHKPQPKTAMQTTSTEDVPF